jgi:hypothetical protein
VPRAASAPRSRGEANGVKPLVAAALASGAAIQLSQPAISGLTLSGSAPQSDDLAASVGKGLDHLGQEFEFLRPGNGGSNIFTVIQDAQLVQIRQRKLGMTDFLPHPPNREVARGGKEKCLGGGHFPFLLRPEDTDAGFLHHVGHVRKLTP